MYDGVTWLAMLHDRIVRARCARVMSKVQRRLFGRGGKGEASVDYRSMATPHTSVTVASSEWSASPPAPPSVTTSVGSSSVAAGSSVNVAPSVLVFVTVFVRVFAFLPHGLAFIAGS